MASPATAKARLSFATTRTPPARRKPPTASAIFCCPPTPCSSPRSWLEDFRHDLLLSADPMQFAKIMAQVFQRVPGEWAGKAAIDIALMDWVGQKLKIPLYSYFGLDPADTPLTTFRS